MCIGCDVGLSVYVLCVVSDVEECVCVMCCVCEKCLCVVMCV